MFEVYNLLNTILLNFDVLIFTYNLPSNKLFLNDLKNITFWVYPRTIKQLEQLVMMLKKYKICILIKLFFFLLIK